MKRHFYWIDWIRFVSAFMVVLCHARGYNWVAYADLGPSDHTRLVQGFFLASRAGPEWVTVLFVLSGFLVGGTIIARLLDKTFSLKNFAVDRVSRIWVPLIPALAFTALLEFWCGQPVSGLEMLGNVIALQGVICDNFAHNAPLWSLSYEVWFYVLAGCTAAAVTRTGIWPLCGITVCFAVFTLLDPNGLECWLLGAFSAQLICRERNILISVLGFLLAFFGAAWSQLESDSGSAVTGSLINHLSGRPFAFLIESLGIGFVLASVCQRKPVSLPAVRAEQLGSALAAFSYTLYLTHYPLLRLWEYFIPERFPRFDGISCLVFAGKILSSLLVAWLLWLPFEAQTPSVRAWLRRRLGPPATPDILSRS